MYTAIVDGLLDEELRVCVSLILHGDQFVEDLVESVEKFVPRPNESFASRRCAVLVTGKFVVYFQSAAVEELKGVGMAARFDALQVECAEPVDGLGFIDVGKLVLLESSVTGLLSVEKVDNGHSLFDCLCHGLSFMH